MNKKSIRNYQIFSIIFSFILGSILHFTYNLSGQNPIVGIFSSINESVWEHLKLIYFPMLITIIIGLFYFKSSIPNFLCAKVVGIIVAMSFIIIFFYTYTGIIGTNTPIIDILSFFIAVILGEIVSYLLIVNNYACNKTLSIIFLICLFLCFVIFTKSVPNLGIFCDSITTECSLF